MQAKLGKNRLCVGVAIQGSCMLMLIALGEAFGKLKLGAAHPAAE